MANTIFISTIEVQHLNDEFHVTINTRNLVQNDFWRAGNPAFFDDFPATGCGWSGGVAVAGLVAVMEMHGP